MGKFMFLTLTYLLIIFFIFADLSLHLSIAQEIKTDSFCASFFGKAWSMTEDQARKYLQKEAMQKILKEQILSDMLKNIIDEEEREDIEIYSIQFLETVDNSEYRHGSSFGQLCIKTKVKISLINEFLFEPITESGTNCSQNSSDPKSLENKSLRRLLFNATEKIEAINIRLDDLDINTVKKLIHEDEVVEYNKYNRKSGQYCTTIEGIIYPLQLKYHSESDFSIHNTCIDNMVEINDGDRSFCIDSREVLSIEFSKDIIVKKNEPISNVTWSEAHRYCLSAEKRLPTKREWELSVRKQVKGVTKNNPDLKEWTSTKEKSGRYVFLTVAGNYDGYGFMSSSYSAVGFRCAKTLLK